MTGIKFLRVIGIRAHNPAVVATIENHLVKWNPPQPWTCDCLDPDDEYDCEHIMTIQDMLDHKVTHERHTA